MFIFILLLLNSYSFQNYSNITKYINFDMDPCNDFYEFACGNWNKIHPLVNNKTEISMFSIISDDIINEIYYLLTANDTTYENIGFKKAKIHLNACLDLENIENQSYLSLDNFLYDLNIPVFLNQSSMDNWNFSLFLIEFEQQFSSSFSLFIDLDVNHDHYNSSETIIRIDSGNLAISKEFLIHNSTIPKSYEFLINEVFQNLNDYYKNPFYKDNQKISVISKQIIEFEKKIAFLLDSSNDNSLSNFHRITLEHLEASIPGFPWYRFVQDVFKNVTILRNESILVVNLAYLYELINLIDSTPKSIVINYIMWRNVYERIPLLNCKLRKLYNNFHKEINNEDAMFPTGCKDVFDDNGYHDRKHFCTNMINSQFGIAISNAYIRKHFSFERLRKIMLIIDEIFQTLKIRIENNTWIDQDTKEKTFEKIDRLTKKIAYPQYIFNETYLEMKFGKVEITNNFFKNTINLEKSFRKSTLGKHKKPIWRQKWLMFPQTLNAMYQFFNNEIILPAGILREPFFYDSDSVPIVLSYGSIGSIIGHELTHAFDSMGRKFDNFGNIVKEWWDGEAVVEFNRRAICFLEQYSKYKITNSSFLDGKRTLAENIADNGGINIAYNAMSDYLGKLNISLTDVPLKGELNMTNEQLFFIAYGQEYCININDKTNIINMYSESHSPANFRVIGSLSNMEEFSKAFKCNENSGMNIKNKCKLW